MRSYLHSIFASLNPVNLDHGAPLNSQPMISSMMVVAPPPTLTIG
jgi:hypothetical protein